MLALAAGKIAGPERVASGYARFAPHFDRVHAGVTPKPYTLQWLADNIGSRYCRNQPSPWVIAGLQANVNFERGTWGDEEIAKAMRGEDGFTCHALCVQYRKESKARLKYVRRHQKEKNPDGFAKRQAKKLLSKSVQ